MHEHVTWVIIIFVHQMSRVMWWFIGCAYTWWFGGMWVWTLASVV